MTSNWLELVAFSRSMIVIPNQANDNDLWTYWEKKYFLVFSYYFYKCCCENIDMITKLHVWSQNCQHTCGMLLCEQYYLLHFILAGL
jgi:hypothetical protein